MKIYLYTLCAVIYLVATGSYAQKTDYNFHQLSSKTGLHDDLVRCIGEDKFGYIWIGTVGALNRFDGKRVRRISYSPGDSNSPYSTQPRSIYSDRKGRLWIGYENGLTEYNFANGGFRKIDSLQQAFIFKIISFSDDIIFLATNRGLVKYDIKKNEAFYYSRSNNPAHAALANAAVTEFTKRHDTLFMATNKGLVILHVTTDWATRIKIPHPNVDLLRFVVADEGGNIWVGTISDIKLLKIFPGLKECKIYDDYLTSSPATTQLNLMGILEDSRNRIWVITAVDGLLEYDPQMDGFKKYLHKNYIPSSPNGNSYRAIYQQTDGTIWLGCDFDGVNFFNPDEHLFETVLPFPDRLDERQRKVGRGFAEDKQGNYWMGTHEGVSKFDPRTGKYVFWQNDLNGKNQLYSNVIRSMLCDDENNIWIGTGSGINRYNSATKRMEFIPEKYLPTSFYNTVTKDRSGNIWFGTNDSASLYWYDTHSKSFHCISEHPALKNFTRFAPVSYVYEDSKNRLWISFGRKGIVMYDKIHDTVKKYFRTENEGVANIAGNQVIDIKEDAKGIIWISTFNGVTGIDVAKNSFQNYDNANGLPGNMVAPIAIDSADRLWIGVSGGLMMLDEKRKQFTLFNETDGISSTGFPEHASVVLSTGEIIMPSNNGYIKFNPMHYKQYNKNLSYYVDAYSIFNEPFKRIPETDSSQSIHFKSYQTSFSFNLVALNYENPVKTWFAYKLEGFEKDWHYTQEPRAVYTNVSGGEYVFQYKACLNKIYLQSVPAKTLEVLVDTVFYKTSWFRALIVLLIVGLFYAFYRYRLHQQKQILTLETKAVALEKEKTMVQYESLKQHLNPHFLFNSLTSLRSLIKTDSQVAAKFLDSLSKVYRYVLKSGEAEQVLLSEELEFASTFIALQKVRFGEGLKVNINIDEKSAQRLVAPVVLQNLLENALKHNTATVNKPLVIDIYTEDDYLVVQNILQRYRLVETSNKKGIESLRKLYWFYTEKAIVIEETEAVFRVKIPLL